MPDNNNSIEELFLTEDDLTLLNRRKDEESAEPLHSLFDPKVRQVIEMALERCQVLFQDDNKWEVKFLDRPVDELEEDIIGSDGYAGIVVYPRDPKIIEMLEDWGDIEILPKLEIRLEYNQIYCSLELVGLNSVREVLRLFKNHLIEVLRLIDGWKLRLSTDCESLGLADEASNWEIITKSNFKEADDDLFLFVETPYRMITDNPKLQFRWLILNFSVLVPLLLSASEAVLGRKDRFMSHYREFQEWRMDFLRDLSGIYRTKPDDDFLEEDEE